MTERDIIHERGEFWVGRTRSPASFTVYRSASLVSIPDSSYPADDGGKSLAIARCDYLGREVDA